MRLVAAILLLIPAILFAAPPSSPPPPYPGVDLYIPAPDTTGPPADFITLISHLGSPLPLLYVYDEGGCTTAPGCRYWNNRNFRFGVLQIDDPQNRPLRVVQEYQKSFQWCASCPKVTRWVYHLYFDE